jgi:IgA Peptidase M64
MTMNRLNLLTVAVFAAVALQPALAQDANPPATVTKVLDSGPDGEKLNIAVLGDGYTANDQQKFNDDVQKLLLDGVFKHDFFKNNRSAFNVYRVNLVSHDQGVSQRTYDEHGTPYDPTDDTLFSHTDRDTALRFIFSGSWSHCWLEPSDTTQARIDEALAKYVATFTYVLVILNQDSYGGCGGSGRQTVTRGAPWDVIAHEYGHGIGDLHDEYFNPGTAYSGTPPILGPNVSTVLDRKHVPWADLIRDGTPVPTPDTYPDSASGPTVGEYEGGATYAAGVYRPCKDCRMSDNTSPFCPVCSQVMLGIVKPHLPASPPVGNLVASQGRQPAGGPAAEVAKQPPPAQPQHAAPRQPGGDSYVQMVLRINEAGQARLVSAVEVPGKATMSQAKAGEYVYEVTNKNNVPVVIHSIPNPYGNRSFPAPLDKTKRETVPGHQAREATIVVRIAGTSLEQAVENDLAFKLYRIKPEPGLAPIQTLTATTMDQLRQDNRLEVRHEIPASRLGPELKRLGRKIERR